MTEMMNIELPILIDTLAKQRTEPARHFPILNSSFALSDTNGLQYSSEFNAKVDIVEFQGGYLLNTEEWLGVELTPDRVAKYTMALKGVFEKGYAERVELAERVQSVCQLIRKKDTYCSSYSPSVVS
jgi:hypothetical protein